MGTALVTGASSGLGRAFSLELARRGHDLVLVARDQARLETLAAELTARHGCTVEVLPADLAVREQVEQVARRLADPQRPVDLLVNNAGFGNRRGFVGGDLTVEERALDVMVRAVMVLSHAAAGAMRERGHGAVLNVSSIASFAVLGTYSAIKSWVTVFSEALATELAGSGVTATAVCPGFVRTEFHDRAEMRTSALPQAGWLDAGRVARDALDAVAAGRVVSVPSARYRTLAAALRVVPRPLLRRLSGTITDRRR
jgi:short-subunit dehydrogenase